ncbi:unnamed protein product [Gadus morhua 'NCC']
MTSWRKEMKRALDYLMARRGHCSTTVCTGLATVSLHTLGTTQPWKASVIRTQSPGSTLVHVHPTTTTTTSTNSTPSTNSTTSTTTTSTNSTTITTLIMMTLGCTAAGAWAGAPEPEERLPSLVYRLHGAYNSRSKRLSSWHPRPTSKVPHRDVPWEAMGDTEEPERVGHAPRPPGPPP